ncbi:DUF6221 family protein [Streptomyces sp. NPDC088745]|uniref:DUF6221 family protein n=1 Tax=Streptomyces sp. NPDC088745 TaxID=3365884 RepID=UPI00381225E6
MTATEPTDLYAFLLERLDDDERAACAATPGQLYIAQTGPGDDVQSGKDAAHSARHTAERVLADVWGRRSLIVDVNDFIDKVDELVDEDDEHPMAQVGAAWRESVLRGLAAAYADHPDYQQVWKPASLVE